MFQKPNTPLIVWAVCSVLLRIIHEPGALTPTPVFEQLLAAVQFGSIFTWSWLEIFQGTNYLRRALGLIVMFFILRSMISVAL